MASLIFLSCICCREVASFADDASAITTSGGGCDASFLMLAASELCAMIAPSILQLPSSWMGILWAIAEVVGRGEGTAEICRTVSRTRNEVGADLRVGGSADDRLRLPRLNRSSKLFAQPKGHGSDPGGLRSAFSNICHSDKKRSKVGAPTVLNMPPALLTCTVLFLFLRSSHLVLRSRAVYEGEQARRPAPTRREPLLISC